MTESEEQSALNDIVVITILKGKREKKKERKKNDREREKKERKRTWLTNWIKNVDSAQR